jgi:hypothetical protein
MTRSKQRALFVIGDGKERRSTRARLDLLVIAAFTVAIILTISLPKIAAQSNNDTSEWPSYAADLASTRYRPLAQIDASNFNKLEVAWTFKTENLGRGLSICLRELH